MTKRMNYFLHRESSTDIPIEVGMPVYFRDPLVDELRLGRILKIVDGHAVVLRNGKRERVPVKSLCIAKKAYKDEQYDAS